MLATGVDAWFLGDSVASFKNSKKHVEANTLFNGL